MLQIKSALVLFFMVLASFVAAENQAPELTIDTGGYTFFSSYKLQKHNSSTLIVNTIVGRASYVMRSYNGPISSGPASLQLNFRLHKKDAYMCTQQSQNTRQGLSAESNIKSSSYWYSSLQAFLTRLGSRFDPFRHKKTEYAIIGVKTSALPERIEPRPGCKLKAMYSIRTLSPLLIDSPLPQRILVDLLAKKKLLKNHGNKPVLIIRATFRTKKRPTMRDPVSVIKFIKTRKELLEFSRKNISRSSMWYPWVKRIAEKGANKYSKLNRKHHKMAYTD